MASGENVKEWGGGLGRGVERRTGEEWRGGMGRGMEKRVEMEESGGRR